MTETRREIIFTELPADVQTAILVWIREKLRPVPWTNRHVSTYGLLDAIDRETGLSISARQLNQALAQSGYRSLKSDPGRDRAQLSWNWNIGIRSPYFLNRQSQG
ncbi:hypothetical protein [uncultured Faecalibaculum sp.]|uniref:hypothetical protein n=1 Tax=uncultured Faecalibaculum sp. TaxID=1729681 RepID=UPI00260EBFA3|nr:hypothetical protein [uncultured Faecalibaculum sp.]